MLDVNLKAQLETLLQKLEQPIELVANLDDNRHSTEMLDFLQETAALSPKITVVERQDPAQRAPSFTITRQDKQIKMTFACIPLGHEFSSFVLALLQASGYPPKVSAEQVEQIRSLQGEFHFETFVSLSCHNCPEVVQALNLMTILNPNVSHMMIDGAIFQQEVEEKDIMAVPTIFLNGKHFGQGRMELGEILAKIDVNAGERDAKKLSAKAAFDVLVIGGGPAGSAAAIYAARKGIVTGVVAERFGGQVMDTMTIANFISVQYTEGPKLAMALEEHVRSYNVDIMNLQHVTKLVPAPTVGGLTEVHLKNGAVLKSRAVIVATGARWRNLNVPGENQYKNKGVAYCPHCDGPLFKGKRVAVIGGGNSGVEAAIDLAGVVSHVTLIEFGKELRADEVLQRRLRELTNVDVITSAQTSEISGDGHRVTGLEYIDRETDKRHRVDLAGVFVQIGLMPNSGWLKDTIKLSPMGEIEVSARGETSVPGIFAAGDVTTVPYKQIIIAMGEGSKAALSAFDYLIRNQ